MKAVIALTFLAFMALAATEENVDEAAAPSEDEHNIGKRSAEYGSHHGGYNDHDDDYYDDDDYTYGYDFFPSYRPSYGPQIYYRPVVYRQPTYYKGYNYVTYPNHYSPYRPLNQNYGHFLYSAHDDHDYGYGRRHHGGYGGGHHGGHGSGHRHRRSVQYARAGYDDHDDHHDHDDHDKKHHRRHHGSKRRGYGSRRGRRHGYGSRRLDTM